MSKRCLLLSVLTLGSKVPLVRSPREDLTHSVSSLFFSRHPNSFFPTRTLWCFIPASVSSKFSNHQRPWFVLSLFWKLLFSAFCVGKIIFYRPAVKNGPLWIPLSLRSHLLCPPSLIMSLTIYDEFHNHCEMKKNAKKWLHLSWYHFMSSERKRLRGELAGIRLKVTSGSRSWNSGAKVPGDLRALTKEKVKTLLA